MLRPAIIGWIALTAALSACADARLAPDAASGQIEAFPSGRVAVTNHGPSWTAEPARGS